MVAFAIIVIAVCLLSGSASAGYYPYYGGYGYGGTVAEHVQGYNGGWGDYIQHLAPSEPKAAAKHVHGLLGFGFGWG